MAQILSSVRTVFFANVIYTSSVRCNRFCWKKCRGSRFSWLGVTAIYTYAPKRGRDAYRYEASYYVCLLESCCAS
jgi:hypothetical protein